MTAPTKINSGNGRTVSRTDVLKADDPAVEREQLNRILKSLDSRLYLAEQAIDTPISSDSDDSSNTLANLSVDTAQLDYLPIGGDAYYLNIAAGGIGTLELADEAVTTAKIDDEAVTFAKMQNIATDRLIGRDTAASGSPEEISLDDTLEFTGTGSIQRAALTGDITAAAGSNATTLATVNANVGTFGSATAVGQVAVNGKGLVTGAADVPIAIPSTQVTDFTEAAQDAVGAMVNSTLTYTDATPLLSINLGNANSWTAAQTFSSVDINGGAIDGTPIGANSASTGAFTTLSASSDSTIGTGTFGGWTSVDDLRILNSGNAGIAIQSGATSLGRVAFGDTALGGYLEYNHSTDVLSLNRISGASIALGLTTVAVAGALSASTTITANGASSGVGYATGAGGTVTQATDKSTGVTLNRPTGTITMNGAALGAGTIVSFTLTNSTIAATDVLILNHSSVGTLGAYTLNATCAAGSAQINVRNNTAGSLSEAIVIRFALIKGVTS